jgi:hypothetical protein
MRIETNPEKIEKGGPGVKSDTFVRGFWGILLITPDAVLSFTCLKNNISNPSLN